MRRAMIVCRSQTEAIKCARILERIGVGSILCKPPRERREKSCAWGVRIHADDLHIAQRCMLEKDFLPDRIYEYEEMNEGRCRL